MDRADIYRRIDSERERQEALHPGETCADAIADALRVTILAEEFGEVARAVLEGKPEAAHKELVELAACCVAWLEGDGR